MQYSLFRKIRDNCASREACTCFDVFIGEEEWALFIPFGPREICLCRHLLTRSKCALRREERDKSKDQPGETRCWGDRVKPDRSFQVGVRRMERGGEEGQGAFRGQNPEKQSFLTGNWPFIISTPGRKEQQKFPHLSSTTIHSAALTCWTKLRRTPNIQIFPIYQ